MLVLVGTTLSDSNHGKIAVYELADKLVELGKTASEAVIAPLMPAFASLRAGGEALRERMLFLQGSKADVLLGGTSFAFLALFAELDIGAEAAVGSHVAAVEPEISRERRGAVAMGDQTRAIRSDGADIHVTAGRAAGSGQGGGRVEWRAIPGVRV